MKKALLTLTLVLAIPLAAQASPVTFTFTNGSNLSAQAVFDVVAGKLQVTLTNTSAFDVLNPTQVLTAVFFDISGVTLTPFSAFVGAGSTVLFPLIVTNNVGGEWAYASGLSGAPGGAAQGISSSGFGLFGDGNFNGSNLQGPDSVDGLQYGITSASDNPATGITPVTGTNALIKNSVVLTLAYTGTLDLSNISNVSFVYGTSLGEVTTPDGGMTITLLGLALAGMGFLARRKK